MSFLQKVRRTLREARARRRSGGTAAATRLLLRHVYSRSTMVLFESRDKRLRLELPAGLDVVQVTPSARIKFELAMNQAGAGADLANFDRGAEAWLLVSGGCGVAIGWRFEYSPIFQPLGYDPAATVYLGGFHVRDEYRGRGLYPYLLQRIFADSPAAGCAIAETALENAASQRGLLKAGFERVGIVQRTMLCGILRCRGMGPLNLGPASAAGAFE